MQPPHYPAATDPQPDSASANGSHIKLRTIISFAAFIGSIFVAAILINQFIFQSYFVDGTSMAPTLQNNDRLIIDKIPRTIDHLFGRPYIPSRGQIVVLDSAIVGINGQNEQLIKRVIGLPGDAIHIENGVVTVKNASSPQGFDADKQLGLSGLATTYADSPQDFTVGPNQVFVMGDNRAQNGSYDSRAFGPIDVKNLQGHLWARVLPLGTAKIFSAVSRVL